MMSDRLTMCPETHIPELPCAVCGLDQRPAWPSQQEAARTAGEAERAHYIVIPASPWGGRTGTLGPMTEAEAREQLAVLLPLYVTECPPKLLRLVEDYAPWPR